MKISGASSKSLRESLKKYNPDIVLTYKYCPDIEENPNAFLAAKAIVAGERQSVSEDLYQKLAGNPELYEERKLFELARSLWIDMNRFKEDYFSEETEKRVLQDIEDSKSSGLVVFPSLTINDEPYNGAWDDESLFAAIEKRGNKQFNKAIESFFDWGASAAAVLIIATFGALLMVNLGFEETYEHWRHTEFGFTFAHSELILPIEIWINDFLMAIFFLLIGLEIKKEVLDGELSDKKRAAMPVIGAIGGMLVPALLYVAVNMGTETSNGWGIPMATDIAFTLGLMALMGTRIPLSLKIFISALAVADDLGAIIVIALFYGHGFHIIPFIGAIVIILLMFVLTKRKVYNVSIYVTLGISLWFFVYKSGLHATLAGVITAMFIPTRRHADIPLIARQTNIIFDREIKKIEDNSNNQKGMTYGSLHMLKSAIERLRDPSDNLMHSLEKVVNFVILPLFAFFNTGILISGDVDLMAPVSIGVLLGLVIGKPLGIAGACWIASKAKVAQLSEEFGWKQLIGASTLAGVGFTMSIVVASSAFHNQLLTTSKISILIASTLSAFIGLAILSAVTKKPKLN